MTPLKFILKIPPTLYLVLSPHVLGRGHLPPVVVLAGVDVVADRSEANEGEGADDQPAEGLHVGQDDDQDELQGVHGGVEAVLEI